MHRLPAILTVSSSSIGDEGSSQEDRTYKVTEIGENALKDAWAFTITFEKNSNLRVIRRRGLYGISCSGAFVLPASLKTIEDEGLYVKSSSKAKQYISELVLPEGLESLAVSSIVLNKLQTLRFLGAVPPMCATAEGETACNPFTAIGCATPEDVDVIVPDGSFDAYRQRSGIGDYFTVFTSYAPETPTGMEETLEEQSSSPADDTTGSLQSGNTARKVMIGGKVLILRDGHSYNVLGTKTD